MNLLAKLKKRDEPERAERRRRRQQQLAEELGALHVFTFDDHTTTSLPQMGGDASH